MPVTIRPYTATDEPSVVDFNRRLKDGSVRFQFPPSHIPQWLPNIDRRKIFQEYFIAVDDKNNVRGGYILKRQDFFIDGKIISIGDYQLPISEGVINKAYNLVGLQLLADALKKQPLMYALGMGGPNQPLPRFLKGMRWSLEPVPFYFRILRPYRFLRNIRSLRTSIIRKAGLDILALTGLGWATLKLSDIFSGNRKINREANIRAESFTAFVGWADEIWNQCRNRYRMIAGRDSETLRILYPEDDRRFIKLRIIEDDLTIGWAVMLNTVMTDHRQFGNMRAGTIVDCLSVPGRENEIITAAAEYLEKEKPDIIVSNQLHAAWTRAFENAGFRKGPSNFSLALSPKLSELIGPISENLSCFHFTRGDGDGPINL